MIEVPVNRDLFLAGFACGKIQPRMDMAQLVISLKMGIGRDKPFVYIWQNQKHLT